jgi:hypothetical protein
MNLVIKKVNAKTGNAIKLEIEFEVSLEKPDFIS